MTIRFAFYAAEGQLGDDFHHFDQMIGAFGYLPTIINRSEKYRNTSAAELQAGQSLHIFPSVAAAHAHYSSLSWTQVFLDPRGTTFTKDHTHAADNVVYYIGSDDDGFDDRTLVQLEALGTVLAIWQQSTGNVLFSTIAAHYAVLDRWIRTPGDWS